MSEPLWMTHDEVCHMTGRERPKAQIRWLERNGVDYFVRADKKIAVARDAAKRVKGRLDRPGPKWEALRA
jgi:hypothetical protein